MTDDELVACLLDEDGSCRDVNFLSPTWAGVSLVLSRFKELFEGVEGSDSTGQQIDVPPSVSSLQGNKFFHFLFQDGHGLLRNLQVFVTAETDGAPFVELTFWPEDLAPTAQLARGFVTWADSICLLLGAKRYFVRYENASWKFGDSSPESGVVLASREIA